MDLPSRSYFPIRLVIQLKNSEKAYAKYQTFSLDEWTILETAGAVFLPAAGARVGKDVRDVNWEGIYYS